MLTDRRADQLDARLLHEVIRAPKATTIALADRVGVSRNTAQARLNRWDDGQVLLGFDRRIDPEFLGYPITAFIFTKVTQRRLAEVSAALAEIAEVIQVHGLSGVADLLVHVVARDADDLYRIAGQILAVQGVKRTETALQMRSLVNYRIDQLIERDHLRAVGDHKRSDR